MTGSTFSGLSSPQRAILVLAGLWVAAALVFLLTHQPNVAVPLEFAHGATVTEKPPEKGATTATEREPLAEEAAAIKDTVGLLVTVSIGLAALAGFAVKDNLNDWGWPKVLSLFLLAAFGFFLTRVFVFGYYAYGTIAVQLSFGRLFLGIINASIKPMAESVLFCAVAACLLFVVRVVK
jgi:hypothetical protein